MTSLIAHKERYYAEFADAMYAKMYSMRYGIGTCPKGNRLEGTVLRKRILDYQVNDDSDALAQVNVNYTGWLPAYYPLQQLSTHPSVPPGRGVGAINVMAPNPAIPENIVEVNSGGCITRININPVINYNETGGGSPVYSAYYTAQADGETVVNLGLAAETRLITVQKGINPLLPSQFLYDAPMLTLIGVALGQGESLYITYALTG